jgi:hypothetical protein
MSKAYLNRKSVDKRPEGDFYSTPKSLVWVYEDVIKKEFSGDLVLEPAAGMGAISEELHHRFLFDVVNSRDIVNGEDYTDPEQGKEFTQVITNPPFSLWDDFVLKAKTHCKKFAFIGRVNYFASVGRYEKLLFKNLKSVHVFNRMVDYRTPYRTDGLFHVGGLVTGWFLWDMEYEGKATIEQLDVQTYAKLGAYKG